MTSSTPPSKTPTSFELVSSPYPRSPTIPDNNNKRKMVDNDAASSYTCPFFLEEEESPPPKKHCQLTASTSSTAAADDGADLSLSLSPCSTTIHNSNKRKMVDNDAASDTDGPFSEEQIESSPPPKKRCCRRTTDETAPGTMERALVVPPSKKQLKRKIGMLDGELAYMDKLQSNATKQSQLRKGLARKAIEEERKEKHARKAWQLVKNQNTKCFAEYQVNLGDISKCENEIEKKKREIARLEVKQARLVKRNREIAEVAQNNKLVTDAQEVHAASETAFQDAKAALDGIDETLEPIEDLLAQEKEKWQLKTPEEILVGKVGLASCTFEALKDLTVRQLQTLRRCMKRFGVRGAGHFNLSRNEKQDQLTDICNVFRIPIPVQPVTMEEEMSVAAAAELLKEEANQLMSFGALASCQQDLSDTESDGESDDDVSSE